MLARSSVSPHPTLLKMVGGFGSFGLSRIFYIVILGSNRIDDKYHIKRFSNSANRKNITYCAKLAKYYDISRQQNAGLSKQ